MKNYPKYLKNKLFSIVRNMAKHPEDFCRHPGKDFTRKRKLDFDNILLLLLKMGGQSLRNEILDWSSFSNFPPTVSAFVQQRGKILPDALEFLFHQFTDTCKPSKLYKGYRLLAVDGTDLQFTADPNDPQCYYPGVNGQRPYSLLHLNALYDLKSHLYLDALVQKSRCKNENAALVQMVERSDLKEPAIVIADRCYESYNTLDRISRKGWRYLIRLRETRGILSNFALPEGPFDIVVQLDLSRKARRAALDLPQSQSDIYRYLPSNVNFSSLPAGSDGCYPLRFRIVRFNIADDSTETLVTNLDKETFSTEALKELYHMRWGIETSFWKLKYTIGLSLFQSKRVESVIQEIFARLCMYNFCELITSHVVIQKRDRKYAYCINFSAAVHVCRQFFRGCIPPPIVEALILQQLVPIRPGRSFPRKTKSTKFNGFLYRIA